MLLDSDNRCGTRGLACKLDRPCRPTSRTRIRSIGIDPWRRPR